MTSLVSVIIPAYNHSKFVQDTIKSIINQTYQNIELIIVDDGSSDDTFKKILEMEEVCKKRFINVVFETKQNEGTCKTLNKLISLSSGEYIYLIASDDLAKEQAIEKEVNFLNNNPDYSLVVGDNEFIDNEGKICYWKSLYNITYSKKKSKYKTFADCLESYKPFKFTDDIFGRYSTLYFGNYIPNGYLIRKLIFDKIGPFIPEAPLEDYWMMLQISKYSKIKYLNEVLFSYRQHDSNTVLNGGKLSKMTEKTKNWEENFLKENLHQVEFQKLMEELENGFYLTRLNFLNIFKFEILLKNCIKIYSLKLFEIKIFQIKKKKSKFIRRLKRIIWFVLLTRKFTNMLHFFLLL